MIHLQALETAFAALRPGTRKTMIAELEHALLDTGEEQSRTNCTKLLLEVGSIKLILNAARKVEQEYDDLG